MSEVPLISTKKQAELLQRSDISKFFEKWRKKRGSTRRPADPIRLFHRPDLLNKRLFFQISSCVRNQGELHNQQDC